MAGGDTEYIILFIKCCKKRQWQEEIVISKSGGQVVRYMHYLNWYHMIPHPQGAHFVQISVTF